MHSQREGTYMVTTVWESTVEICYKTVNTFILFGPIILLLGNNFKETIRKKKE